MSGQIRTAEISANTEQVFENPEATALVTPASLFKSDRIPE
jgi:hypothetical protein